MATLGPPFLEERIRGRARYFFQRTRTRGAARDKYLGEVCGDNTALRHRIEALLNSAAKVSRFMEAPAPGVDASPTLNRSIVEQPGTIIGPYKLVTKIGEGGMGVVYMAEQTGLMERQVALKIIKPGMDTRQVIARFEAERQALAMMDHPDIAGRWTPALPRVGDRTS